MILNARQNGFMVLLPQNFFNPEIEAKYEKYYRNLLLPYRSIADFMSSTIQTVSFPSFSSQLAKQVRPLGKEQESQSAKPIADMFTREVKLTFKLTDSYLNYFIFLDNALNYLEPANINPDNTGNSLGRALTNLPERNVNHPAFGPIRLTLLNNEGYAVSSIIFNRPQLTNMSDLTLSYSSVTPQFATFSTTFKYFNFDLETDFA
jgi:hypothetical protein